jgi:hypothetical protein
MFSVRVSELNSAISCQLLPSCLLPSFRYLSDDASGRLRQCFSDTTVGLGVSPKTTLTHLSPVTFYLNQKVTSGKV